MEYSALENGLIIQIIMPCFFLFLKIMDFQFSFHKNKYMVLIIILSILFAVVTCPIFYFLRFELYFIFIWALILVVYPIISIFINSFLNKSNANDSERLLVQVAVDRNIIDYKSLLAWNIARGTTINHNRLMKRLEAKGVPDEYISLLETMNEPDDILNNNSIFVKERKKIDILSLIIGGLLIIFPYTGFYEMLSGNLGDHRIVLISRIIYIILGLSIIFLNKTTLSNIHTRKLL